MKNITKINISFRKSTLKNLNLTQGGVDTIKTLTTLSFLVCTYDNSPRCKIKIAGK